MDLSRFRTTPRRRGPHAIALALLGFAIAAACASVARGPADAATVNGAMAVVPATSGSPAVPVYVARPSGDGPFPAVLVLHGCEGFDGFYAVAADRLALMGYLAIAPDANGIASPDACGTRGGSIREASDARATLAWARARADVAPDRLAIVGFSMGALAALDLIDPDDAHAAATPPGVRAAVAYYPNCDGRAPGVAVPLAIFDGDADRITPAAPCAAFAKAAAAAGKRVDLTTYPGATHGFLIPGERTFFGEPVRFDADAAADSARKTAAFLARYLAP